MTSSDDELLMVGFWLVLLLMFQRKKIKKLRFWVHPIFHEKREGEFHGLTQVLLAVLGPHLRREKKFQRAN